MECWADAVGDGGITGQLCRVVPHVLSRLLKRFAAVSDPDSALLCTQSGSFMVDLSTQCVDVERDFNISELFFSTTNRQGVIRSGNAVFMRISGYEDHELIGFAHSKVRHPDMPYAVFQLFWDTILAGQSIAAFVKNRAKAGEFYWVMAVAAPTKDGFLSIRLKPSCGLLDTVEKVYTRVREKELAAQDQGASKEEVVQLGMALLTEELKTLGFDSYEAFMWHALSAEMVSRQRQLGRTKTECTKSTSHPPLPSDATALERLRNRDAAFDSVVSTMLNRLTELHSAIEAFPTAAAEMQEQSRLIGMAALNSRISAETEPLKAVAQAMAESEEENRTVLGRLRDTVGTLTLSLDELSFNVCVAALQGEVCSHFLTEIDMLKGNVSTAMNNDLALLIESSRCRLDELFRQLDKASGWFRTIETLGSQLECTDRQLQFIRLVGITESAGLAADHTFRDLFGELQDLLDGMRRSCDALVRQVSKSKSVIRALGHDKLRVTDLFRSVLSAHGEYEREVRDRAEDSAVSAA